MQKNIPLFKVFTAPEAPKLAEEVLLSGYTGQCDKVEQLEEQLRNKLNNPYINTLNSATSGLHLSYHIINTIIDNNQHRDEVLTSNLTCLAATMPIIANNLKIKWIDTDPNTCNINLKDLENKISERTKLISFVHWAGNPVDIDEVKRIAKKCYTLYGYEPPIVEDAAHAWDAKYKGSKIGNSGNFCVFSLQSIKHISAGDGGILISPNEELHKIAKLKRWFGLDRTSSASYRCQQQVLKDMWGFKFHMNDIAASLTLANLNHSDWIMDKFKSNGKFYDRELTNIPGLQTMKILDNCESSYWIYTILVEDRDGFCRKLKEYGIETSSAHRRNDIQPCFAEFKHELPGTNYIDSKMTNIASGWWVNEEDRQYIVDVIKSGW